MKKVLLKTNISANLSYSDAVMELVRLSELPQGSYVCLVNVHMLIEAKDSAAFQNVVNSADLALPDGMPIAKSIKILHGIPQERIAGMDLMDSILAVSETLGKKVFLYGSTEDVLLRLSQKATSEYPELNISYYSPPFRKLSDAEDTQILKTINKCNPDFVLVALGCPKQEIWMHKHKNSIASCLVGLGGAFPVYSGDVTRAPEWMQKNGLEWFYRLCKEPKRLWKRYTYTNTKFLLLLCWQFIRIKVLKECK